MASSRDVYYFTYPDEAEVEILDVISTDPEIATAEESEDGVEITPTDKEGKTIIKIYARVNGVPSADRWVVTHTFNDPE